MSTNNKTKEEAIKALLNGATDEEIESRRIVGKIDEDGVRIITYSLDATPKAEYAPNTDVKNSDRVPSTVLEPIYNTHYTDQIYATFREIEVFANVKFVPAANAEEADIKMFLATNIGNRSGYATSSGTGRYVVLDKDPTQFEHALAH